MRRSRLGKTSQAQRDKAAMDACRVCRYLGGSDPAHVISRAQGGCDDPLCVVPLCRHHHREYDTGTLDLLPYLFRNEQAHAVGHVGIVSAYQRTTNARVAA